jgi:hypothetical protein
MAVCYNGAQLFPNDNNSWGPYDILDARILIDENDNTVFRRTFYSSQNGSCRDMPTDEYDLPLNECVGPFGKPRPWGIFSLLDAKGTERAKHPTMFRVSCMFLVLLILIHILYIMNRFCCL